ncbi:hypothetical protein [Frankia sp. AgB32]|uniref:hypothetical protein n=1 Tax=Frankia sp. AgB32 TaxID=631119 RepID=UPI00200EE1B0|nr:hypothetical protein [Frankia sp. AgB32]MCK9895096.1 hypothetical protein [Frankia sp. AgB32]
MPGRPTAWEASSAVPGFLPSTRAFRFSNDFAAQPLLGVRAPGLPWGIGIGDASRGLCGGMIFAVRDLAEARLDPSPDPTPPARGSPLYAYLVRRLFDSFDLPRGVARYYGLMRGPDAGPRGRPGVGARSLADEWPRIRLDLDTGRLAPIGIVTVRSADPRQLGLNHQVLAYAYRQLGTVVTLRVHDPNTPVARADDVTMSFDLAQFGGLAAVGAGGSGAEAGPARIDHSIAIGGRPVRAFFHSRYRWADPSPALR